MGQPGSGSALSRRWLAARELVAAVGHASTEDNVPMLAAAMAYWLLVTLAPFVLALSAIGDLVRGVTGAGAEAAASLPDTSIEPLDLTRNALEWAGPWAPWIALGIVFFGATAVFAQYVGAVARIWKQAPERNAAYLYARRHALAFVLLIAVAIALIVAAVVGTVLARAATYLATEAARLGVTFDLGALELWRYVALFVAAGLLFTLAVTLVPVRRPRLADVWPGSVATAFAFVVGQWVLERYLASTPRFDVYGSFGVFIAFLVGAYYTALIVLMGTVLTHELVLRRERAREPDGS